MTHLYDAVEPSVLSETLLRQCVEEQGPEGEAGKIARAEGIEVTEVQSLSLSFKNILRIENLWQFKNLRHLQLDNNIIENIEGLEQLVHLEWLDLSFNNIECIQGLQTLVNLRDLSLSNNRVARIERLDSLKRLQTLSLANNSISDMDEVNILRQLEGLQCLTLMGNPLAEDGNNYPQYVIAYLPSLLYLDFQLVMEETRHSARETFHELLEEVELMEREEARTRAEKLAMQKQEAGYKEAYVDGLQGTALFNAIFEEDLEASRIQLLPGIHDMLDDYKTSFVKTCEDITAIGLAEAGKRKEELRAFREVHQRTCQANQRLSVQRLDTYMDTKHSVRPASSQTIGVSDSHSNDLLTDLDKLDHDLIQLEMQLVEQLEELTKDFERNYTDLTNGFVEQVQALMTQLRELENKFHESVTDKAQSLLDKFIKNQLKDLPDELRILFVDKDTLMGALNSSHDTHMLAIDKKEDSVMQRAKKDLEVLTKGVHSEEHIRNRRKVTEIEQFITQQRVDWEAMEHESQLTNE